MFTHYIHIWMYACRRRSWGVFILFLRLGGCLYSVNQWNESSHLLICEGFQLVGMKSKWWNLRYCDYQHFLPGWWSWLHHLVLSWLIPIRRCLLNYLKFKYLFCCRLFLTCLKTVIKKVEIVIIFRKLVTELYVTSLESSKN